MRIKTITVGPFEMNCYVVAEDAFPECLIIDPGDEPERIIKVIEDHGLEPTRIVNTHNHIDHIRHVSKIQDHFNIPFYLCEDDLPLLESIKSQGLLFGLPSSEPPKVSGFLKEGDSFKLHKEQFQVFFTPGHSPGSICIYVPGHVFVGDVLFKDSIGRTDLLGGSYEVLMNSIRTKLLTLPDDTIVYPGHGPVTTIGREKQFNPFINPTQSPF
jgi:hydroxyacylglutathione hydrolase